MAFTIISSPHIYAPVYNQMNLTVSDTSVPSLAGYKYVFDVYAKRSEVESFTNLGRYSINPDVTTGYGTIDLSSILRPMIYFNNYRTLSITYWGEEQTNIKYYVNISRQYYNGTSYVTEALQTYPNNYIAWCGSYSFNQFLDYSTEYSTNVLPRVGYKNYLSNIKDETDISLDEYYVVDHLSQGPYSGVIYRNVYTKFFVYNIDGTSRSYTLQDAYFPKTFDQLHRYTGIGPKNWMSLSAGSFYAYTVPSGQSAFPIYRVGDYKYEVKFYNSVPKQLFTTLTFNLKTLCLPEKQKRTWLVYRSKKGGLSLMLFDGKPYKEQSVDKSTFVQRLPLPYNNMNGGTTVYSSTENIKHILNKNWLDNEDITFIDDIIASAETYIYKPFDANGNLNTYNKAVTPVMVNANSIVLPEQWTSGSRSFSITVEEINNQNLYAK